MSSIVTYPTPVSPSDSPPLVFLAKCARCAEAVLESGWGTLESLASDMHFSTLSAQSNDDDGTVLKASSGSNFHQRIQYAIVLNHVSDLAL